MSVHLRILSATALSTKPAFQSRARHREDPSLPLKSLTTPVEQPAGDRLQFTCLIHSILLFHDVTISNLSPPFQGLQYVSLGEKKLF